MKTKNFFLVTMIALFGVIVESNAQDNTVYRANVTEPASGNVFIGPASGTPNANTTSLYNVAVGNNAGVDLTSGGGNVFLGNYAGYRVTSGANNIFLGSTAGNYCTTGAENIIIGMGHQSYNDANFYGGGNVILGNRLNLYQSAGPFNFLDNPNTPEASDPINNYIILADGGFGRTTAAIRFLIDDLGRAGLGTFLPKNKLEIKNDDTQNSSGLRFTNLTSSFTPIESATKFLTVDPNGDVILANASTGGNPTGNFWSLNGNSGTAPNIASNFSGTVSDNNLGNYIGTFDDKDVVFRRFKVRSGFIGITHTFFGRNSGRLFATESLNPATGNNLCLGSNAGGGTSANDNTITGTHNVLIGSNAGSSSSTTNNPYLNLSNPLAPKMNSQLVINSSASSTNNDFPLVHGNFTTRGLVFGLGSTNIQAPIASKLILNGATTTPSLRLPNTINTLNTVTNTTNSNTINNNKFLTTNDQGDVVLQDLPANLGGCSLYSCDGTLNTSPTSSNNPNPGLRTVTMANNNLFFSTNAANDGYGRVFIGSSLNFPTINNVGPNFSQYRLLVEGGILTEKVKVATNGTIHWADYVFADDYKLIPLSDVEVFIKQNNHLPGIESAETISKEGLDLGDMQAKQMAKIEELTLYAIEQNNQLKKQNKEIEELKLQVKLLLEKR